MNNAIFSIVRLLIASIALNYLYKRFGYLGPTVAMLAWLGIVMVIGLFTIGPDALNPTLHK